MKNQISREEVRSAIEDKLCAQFSVSSEEATDEQIFQATAIVIRELMSGARRRSTTCPWSSSWAAAS